MLFLGFVPFFFLILLNGFDETKLFLSKVYHHIYTVNKLNHAIIVERMGPGEVTTQETKTLP